MDFTPSYRHKVSGFRCQWENTINKTQKQENANHADDVKDRRISMDGVVIGLRSLFDQVGLLNPF